MLRRTVAVTALLSTVALPSTGCFLFPEAVPTAVFQRDDVSLETPGGGFRVLGERGEVMVLADEVAGDVNRWVAEMTGGFGEMLEELNQHPPTSEDGDWRVYGPEDADEGEDASWMARVSGDMSETRFEVWVGSRGADDSDMVQLFTGHLVVDEESRSGGFTIDFDVIAKLAVLQDDIDDGEEFGGSIAVEFSRDLDTQYKYVDLDFEEFYYVNPKEGEDFNYRGETYAYHREADGEGVFHFATWAPFEDEGWSGPERERVTVDMAWDADNAGRARAQILEVEGAGDLRHGDIRLNECFDAGYAMTWANLNDPYASEHPDYNEGKESACLLPESALDGFEG